MFEALAGNPDIKELLSGLIEKKELSHAYIIEGARGIGKHTLAYNIASALAGDNPALTSRINEGKCPDVQTVGIPSDRKTIGVELVRELGARSAVTPNELDFKLTVIENADMMTFQAQNAFLKLLEEPPAEVYFLMLCENASALLPTVRSRAPSLRMRRCGHADIERYLSENSKSAHALKAKDSDAYETAIRMADGCIGRALELVSSGKKAAAGKSISEKSQKLIQLVSERRSVPIIHFVSSLGTDRSELSAVISTAAEACRDLLWCKAHMMSMLKKTVYDCDDKETLCFYESFDTAAELAQRISQGELIRVVSLLGRIAERLNANGNSKQILNELAFGLKRIVC